jgi:hypothetical protein
MSVPGVPRMTDTGPDEQNRLDVLDIHTWKDDCDPTRTPWRACLGEYDEGTRVFSGGTQREAIDDLLDYYEQDNGELHQ